MFLTQSCPLSLVLKTQAPPIMLLTSYVPLPALPGNPEHREMGETLPEEPGEYSVPFGDSVMPHPELPDGLEPARSGSREFSWEPEREWW